MDWLVSLVFNSWRIEGSLPQTHRFAWQSKKISLQQMQMSILYDVNVRVSQSRAAGIKVARGKKKINKNLCLPLGSPRSREHEEGG